MRGHKHINLYTKTAFLGGNFVFRALIKVQSEPEKVLGFSNQPAAGAR